MKYYTRTDIIRVSSMGYFLSVDKYIGIVIHASKSNQYHVSKPFPFFEMFFVMMQIIFERKVHMFEKVMKNIPSFLFEWNDQKAISDLFEVK